MPNWTVKSLYANSQKLAPTRVNLNPSPSVRLDKIIPFAGVNTVLFQLTLKGITEKTDSGYPVNHRVNLLFYGLNVVREPVEGYLKVSDKTGDYWFSKISAVSSAIRWRCTCKDSYFTWLIWSFQEGALFGDKPRPYRRKTKNYPQRNPRHIVGGCRHLFLAIKYLQSNKLMVN